MKEMRFKQMTQQGQVDGVLRVIGKLIYFKFHQSAYGDKLISQMREKGAEIETGKGWVKVNMFKDKSFVKLGDEEFNINTTPDDDIEEILLNFYVQKYTEAKFIVQVIK